ncbi:uncharacterized protein BDV14DRAFT_203280 [Aspergillus stella-maris]|uniref:uncharacterized protein n=1 Tax=Aspergillus stella-maris TaxID=1810926 RepID=UPI003CCD088B
MLTFEMPPFHKECSGRPPIVQLPPHLERTVSHAYCQDPTTSYAPQPLYPSYPPPAYASAAHNDSNVVDYPSRTRSAETSSRTWESQSASFPMNRGTRHDPGPPLSSFDFSQRRPTNARPARRPRPPLNPPSRWGYRFVGAVACGGTLVFIGARVKFGSLAGGMDGMGGVEVFSDDGRRFVAAGRFAYFCSLFAFLLYCCSI